MTTWETQNLVIWWLGIWWADIQCIDFYKNWLIELAIWWTGCAETRLAHEARPWLRYCSSWASPVEQLGQTRMEEHTEGLAPGWCPGGTEKAECGSSGPCPLKSPRPSLFYHMGFLWGKNTSVLKWTETNFENYWKRRSRSFGIITDNTFRVFTVLLHTVLSTSKTFSHLVLTPTLWGRWLTSSDDKWTNGLSVLPSQGPWPFPENHAFWHISVWAANGLLFFL